MERLLEMSIHELRDQPHWSYSAFNTYLQCPMKYKFRYVDNAPVERTCSALPFGRAFHAALSERARVGMDLKLTDTKEIFADFFKVETDAAENLRYKANETFDSLLNTGFDMLTAALPFIGGRKWNKPWLIIPLITYGVWW